MNFNSEELWFKLLDEGLVLDLNGNNLKLSATKSSLSNEDLLILKDSKENFLNNLLPYINRGEVLSLSSAQKAIWLDSKLEPNSPSYNVSYAFKVETSVKLNKLNRAFQTVVKGNDILRSNYIDFQGRPMMIIHPNKETIVETIDVSSDDELHSKIREFCDRIFNLEKDLLVRALMIQKRSSNNLTEHYLVLCIHHIAIDFSSFKSFIADLMSAYQNEFGRGLPTLIRPQYSSYVSDKLRNPESHRREKEFWKEKLKGYTNILKLPTDFQRPKKVEYRGNTLSFSLESDLAKNAIEYCKRSGVTPFTFMITSIFILLNKLTNQTDIVIGAPVSVRETEEDENTIGCFANTNVIRINTDGSVKLDELIKNTHKEFLESLEYSKYPTSKILDDLKLQRMEGFSPLYQVIVSWHQEHEKNHSISGDQIRLTKVFSSSTGSSGALNDLSFVIHNIGNKISYTITYNSSLFKEDTIIDYSSYLEEVIARLVKAEEQNLDSVSLLSDNKKLALLESISSGGIASLSKSETILSKFLDIVSKYGNKTALQSGSESISYHNLNLRSDDFAKSIRSSMDSEGTNLIAIAMSRSTDMVALMLASLKIGASYLLLDLNHPDERLKTILNNSDASLFIYEDENRKRFASYDLNNAISINQLQSVKSSNDIQYIYGNANSVATLIFTSGSTGTPKGVQITNEGILNLALNMPIDSTDNLLSISNLAFDAISFEIWSSLLSGASCILHQESYPSVDSLSRYFNTYEVTTMLITTALFNEIVEYDPTLFGSINKLFVGGDSLISSFTNKCYSVNQDLVIYNAYGPAENSTITSYYQVPKYCSINAVPIGRPLKNVNCYILDQNLEPVPVGVEGELFISGKSLALGYLNSDGATDKFVKNPFNKEGHERLYKTGDIVKFDSDGVMHFCGRSDFQVKIRGFRLDLSEVKNAVLECNGVNLVEIIDLVAEDKKKEIAAYLTVKEASITEQDIFIALREKVPAYMVPKYINIIDSIPITKTGKVDRKKLPKPKVVSTLKDKGEKIKCSSELTKIEQFWCDALSVSPESIDASFFESGGDSLIAIRLIAKINKEFSSSLTVEELLMNPYASWLENKITL